jgi:recombination protein U
MEITKNRGMYAENLFTRSCDYYRQHDFAIIEKRMLPINILKRINSQTIIGRLLAKSYVDYCGCYKGQHIEIEVKETNEKHLSLTIVKPHQLDYMRLVIRHGAKVFLLVYFSLYEKFYLINFT